MKKIVAVFLAVCMIELLTLPAYALDLENNKYILASEYKSADSEVQKRIEQDCNSFSQMGLDKEWVRIVKIDGVDDREILYAVCSMDNTAYVTLSYHAGAIIANMSDPDGKTTELIYISPTNIWINGQRVAFETEEVEVAQPLNTARMHNRQYSTTPLYGSASEYTKNRYYKEKQSVTFSNFIKELVWSAIAVVIAAAFSAAGMPGITAGIISGLATAVANAADSAPSSTVGSFYYYGSEHITSIGADRQYKYEGRFYLQEGLKGASSPFTYYCHSYYS